MPPLHVAAYNADVQAVRQLLAAGAQPDLRDEKGYTPLLWASFRAAVVDQVPVIEALIAAGADPDAINSSGDSSCLILAAQSGCELAVAALVAGGANVDRQADGVTALMVAARMGEVGVVRLLLQLGANPAARAGRFTAADYARHSAHDDLADLLDRGTIAGPFQTSA
jgi:ankyrin repeat protein